MAATIHRSASETGTFSPELFAFLRDLRANNDREWFRAHRERYEDAVQEPALRFISSFEPLLGKISPHFVADARPIGGSLFRIYRDVRFAKDKSPYKTHASILFRHERAKDVHAPGFYVHLEPGNVFAGAGIWHPDQGGARRIRTAIVQNPDRWTRTTREGAFGARFSLGGDSLKRPPAGYSGDHPLIEDLKRKDFTAHFMLDERAICSPAFPEELADAYAVAAPFMRFLCEALEVPF